MKKLFKYALPVFAIVALASCSDDDSINTPVDPYNGKELIDFAGDGSGITRASLTRAGFASQTKVVMRIKAEEVVASTPALPARYAKAEATASANITSDTHSTQAGDHSDLTYVAGQERFWDDAFGRNSKLTVWAFAIPNMTTATLPTWSETGWTQVNENTNPNWYTDSGEEDVTVSWDVTTTQDGTTMQTKDLTYSNNISSTGKGGRYTHTYNSETSEWSLANTLADGQMIWIAKESGSTTGKFDQGHLIFKRALAKIEIRLKEGDGFNNTVNTDFKWSKNKISTTQNITLKNLYTNGIFDVSTGTWPTTNANDITQMYETTASSPDPKTVRTLFAYVLPGNNLASTSTNVIEFEIDNAKYYVTGTQIANAIKDYYKVGGTHANEEHAADYRSFTVTEQGKHYIINLTVAKKGIERITAAIIDWEKVNSTDADAKNTYPTFDLEDRGEKLVSGDVNEFNIYRAAKTATGYIIDDSEKDYDWATGYITDGVAAKTWDGTNSVWKTGWYWFNNLTYYHFRATGIYNGDASSDPAIVSATNDNFVIHSGALSGSSYKDYMWGAPFKELDSPTSSANTAKLTYSTTTGFDNQTGTGTSATHQISQAIGATTSTIHMLLFHMTSQIIVNVNTTTTADKVVLEKNSGATDADKTKVEILNFLPDGTVLMGNGLVSATAGARTTAAAMTYGSHHDEVTGTTPKAEYIENYTYGIVPQELSTGGQTIGLRITTPDGNQYVVRDISTLTATVTTDNLSNPYTETGSGTNKYTINRWYPNYKYTYNITIKKKGIERITAAVVGWETVTGDNINIDLEN